MYKTSGIIPVDGSSSPLAPCAYPQKQTITQKLTYLHDSILEIKQCVSKIDSTIFGPWVCESEKVEPKYCNSLESAIDEAIETSNQVVNILNKIVSSL
jgi:hypothetical protein